MRRLSAPRRPKRSTVSEWLLDFSAKTTGDRTQRQMGAADPGEKMDEKLKSENMQNEQFSMFMLYYESNQDRQV